MQKTLQAIHADIDRWDTMKTKQIIIDIRHFNVTFTRIYRDLNLDYLLVQLPVTNDMAIVIVQVNTELVGKFIQAV